MDRYNYQYAVENALKVRSKAFDLEKLLKEHEDRTTWFSHFLCEANRVSLMGLGGDAFRAWYAGIYRNSVYLYSYSYHLGLCFSSDPNAKPIRGCQDSRCWGDPCPKLTDGARWISPFSEGIPLELKNRIILQAYSMAREAAGTILRVCWGFKIDEERAEVARQQAHTEMLKNWQHAS